VQLSWALIAQESYNDSVHTLQMAMHMCNVLCSHWHKHESAMNRQTCNGVTIRHSSTDFNGSSSAQTHSKRHTAHRYRSAARHSGTVIQRHGSAARLSGTVFSGTVFSGTAQRHGSAARFSGTVFSGTVQRHGSAARFSGTVFSGMVQRHMVQRWHGAAARLSGTV